MKATGRSHVMEYVELQVRFSFSDLRNKKYCPLYGFVHYGIRNSGLF